MKYKTFRALVIVAATAVIGGLVFYVRSCNEEQRIVREAEREARAERVGESQAEREAYARRVAEAGASQATPLVGAPGERPEPRGPAHESRLRTMLGSPSGGEVKRKDLLGGGPVKVNVYGEDGVWVRAKVDLDRDDRWDEKWRFDGGVILRQVAAADDENYGEEAPLDPPATAVAAAGQDAPSASGGPPSELRQVDELMLSLLSRPVQKKIKDASKGRPFKINLYSDGGARFERAKVDLDRDDRWDEKWTFGADGAVSRTVSPGDDENYSESYALEAGVRWVATP